MSAILVDVEKCKLTPCCRSFVWRGVLTVVALVLLLHPHPGNAATISKVDTSLSGSQKYTLMVDGKPFYMTSVQIRLDKLRYSWGFDAAARAAVVAQAAQDGFNTVALPIHWYEVEPAKDKFNWTILDEYLNLARKNNVRVELLWFGQNSGGHVQWLGSPQNPVHLRTPDYVLYSPGVRSSQTTSEYAIRRDVSPYTLDLANEGLRAREVYVLGRVMNHIADWDAASGSAHTVVGVQLDNEVRAFGNFSAFTPAFSPSLVVSYMSSIGKAVKNSRYVVWTRLNCVNVDTYSRIDANEFQRVRHGTGIDFFAADLYNYKAGGVRTFLPFSNGNYRMIAEAPGDIPEAPMIQLAALSGDAAYIYYEFLGPDRHGIYDRDGAMGFKPRGSYVDTIRTINKLLNSDMYDVALKSQGHSLYVHNWTGDLKEESIGVKGISFMPAVTNSQAISIARGDREVVLMNTLGGTFSLAPGQHITAATWGYFDANNAWVAKGAVPYSQTAISPAPGTTVRLILSK